MVAGTSFATLEEKIIAETGTDVHYTKGDIKWFSKDTNGSGNYTEATGKTALEGGKSYQVEITLNAATNWAFTDAAKTAITLPGSKTATGTLGADNKTLTFTVELGAVEANPNQGATVAATAAGTVKGTPTVDGTAGNIDSKNNKITITLTGDYKFSDTEVNKITANASSLIKAPTTTGLVFAAALKAGDDTAKTLEITVSGTPTKEITDNIVIDDAALKGLIVTSTNDALDKEIVKITSTAKFAITASGGGNEDTNKVSAVVITEPAADKTVNLNDTTTDANKITFKANLQNSASTSADITEANKTIKWSVAKAEDATTGTSLDGDTKFTTDTDTTGGTDNFEVVTDASGISTVTLTIGENETIDKLTVTAAYEGTDAATDGATPATKSITIVTKATETEKNTIAGFFTSGNDVEIKLTDVDTTADANAIKKLLQDAITEKLNTIDEAWAVKEITITDPSDITLTAGQETKVTISVTFTKGGVEITDAAVSDKQVSVTAKTA